MRKVTSVGNHVPRPPTRPLAVWPLSLLIAAATVLGIAHHLDIDIQALLWGAEDMAEYLSRFGTPEFSGSIQIAKLMAETLAIAIWGTAIAVFLAVILAGSVLGFFIFNFPHLWQSIIMITFITLRNVIPMIPTIVRIWISTITM